MLQYTRDTLRTALTQWNVNSDPLFVATLPEIVKRGEIRLSRLLDLDNLDSKETTVTVASTLAVAKPTSPLALIDERVVTINVASQELPMLKRSRAWVQMYNKTTANTGTPKYYAELSETQWAFAPIPAGVYTVTVHGNYCFASIEDGAGGGTTWFSTQVPDLLYYACSIEACEFLKAWAKKAQNESDLAQGVQLFTGTARNLQRSDIEDIIANRMNRNQAGTQSQ